MGYQEQSPRSCRQTFELERTVSANTTSGAGLDPTAGLAAGVVGQRGLTLERLCETKCVSIPFHWTASLMGWFHRVVHAVRKALHSVARALHVVWTSIRLLLHLVLSLPGLILDLLGIMLEKKLRLAVLIQSDQQGHLVVDPDVVVKFVKFTVDTYKSQANVKVIPAQAGPLANGIWLHQSDRFVRLGPPEYAFIYTSIPVNSSDTLDVCCDACAWRSDLTRDTGTEFDAMMRPWNRYFKFGYADPVCAFAVAQFSDQKTGCSLGPWADYVTVNFGQDPSSSTLAHELGHACSLWHRGWGNLMCPDQPHPPSLHKWQAVLLRMSAHVTYL
jgi:hypothetical protein